MFRHKKRLLKYSLRLPSSRVTPTNSLSDLDWNNVSSSNRKTSLSTSNKKIKRYSVSIIGALTIATLIVIAVLLPSLPKSKSTSTTSAVVTPGIIALSLVTTSAPSSTSGVTTTSVTSTISTNLYTTTTVTTTISTSNTTTQSTTSSTSITTSETTTSTISTTTTTTTTTSTTSTSTTTSETTTSTTDTSTTTTVSTTSTTSTSSTTSSTTTTSVTTVPLRWNATGKTVAGSLSSSSATPTYLSFPISVIIDSSDSLYVADAKNNRIQKFFYGNNTGTTVAGQANGTVGSSASYLNYPNDMAVDSNGNIYAVDSYNDRVQFWPVNSTSGTTVAGNGTAGNTTSQVSSPRGIAFDPNTNTFYVSEALNNRVMSYTRNSTVGTLVAGGNGNGTGNTQLSSPRGLYYDSSTKSLVIANMAANNIVRWVIGASYWTLLAGNMNGTAGNDSMTFEGPWDVTFDPMGNMYVADRFNQRVQFFRAGEMNGTTIAGVTNLIGTSATMLHEPISVALDSQLNLYVADLQNNRVQKFSLY